MKTFYATAAVENGALRADVDDIGAHTFISAEESDALEAAGHSPVHILRERIVEAVLAATDEEDDFMVVFGLWGMVFKAKHLGVQRTCPIVDGAEARTTDEEE